MTRTISMDVVETTAQYIDHYLRNGYQVEWVSFQFRSADGRTVRFGDVPKFGRTRSSEETIPAPSEKLRDSAENFAREMTLDVHGPGASESDMRRVSEIVCESMLPHLDTCSLKNGGEKCSCGLL